VIRALDHARIAEGPAGPPKWCPASITCAYHVRRPGAGGADEGHRSLGVIDPDERVQSAQ